MNLKDLRTRSELLARLPGPTFDFLEGLAHERQFAEGSVLFEEDHPADEFYIISEGKVGLELHGPGRRSITVHSLGAGDLVGVSWVFPPYRWNWRARAVVDTTVAAFDAAKVRAETEVNRELDRILMGVVAAEAVDRLHSARVQLLDLYGRDAH